MKSKIKLIGKHKAEAQILKMLSERYSDRPHVFISKNAIYVRLKGSVNKNAIGTAMDAYKDEINRHNKSINELPLLHHIHTKKVTGGVYKRVKREEVFAIQGFYDSTIKNNVPTDEVIELATRKIDADIATYQNKLKNGVGKKETSQKRIKELRDKKAEINKKKTNNNCIEGSFIMRGVRYNYKVDGCEFGLSTGNDHISTSCDEIFIGHWIVFHEDFVGNSYHYKIFSDDEFEALYDKCESKDIRVLGKEESNSIKSYNISILFEEFEHHERKLTRPIKTLINGKEPNSKFLMWLGSVIMESSRVLSWDHPEIEVKREVKREVEYVYLMIDHNTNYYKIGISKNPKFREKTLQSEKPTIELLHKFIGSRSKEKELHRRYKDSNIRGEWFDLKKQDVDFIKTL